VTVGRANPKERPAARAGNKSVLIAELAAALSSRAMCGDVFTLNRSRFNGLAFRAMFWGLLSLSEPLFHKEIMDALNLRHSRIVEVAISEFIQPAKLNIGLYCY